MCIFANIINKGMKKKKRLVLLERKIYKYRKIELKDYIRGMEL